MSTTAKAAEDSVRLAQAAPSQPTPAQPTTSQPAPAQPATPEPPQQPAQDAQQPDAQQQNQTAADSPQADAVEEPVGNVATLQGTATVTRNGASAPLKLKDDIFKGDTLQTGKSSTLIVTFTDDTTLNLSASSRVVVDNFIYEEGGKANAALINVARGTMAFVAAAVAKTGDMKIETPTATLGIRGTTGVVDVPEGASASSTTNNVGVKLYPDADGKVGRIEVRARDGAQLGMLTQGASGFTVRGEMVRGFGMRMSVMPMVMSAQQMARDRGFVQRVHVMQSIGRNIVREQRTFRMQDPQRQNGFGRPGSRQPGLQRQNGLQNQPGLRNQPAQQPGLRNPQQAPQRPGLQNRPGQPQQKGQDRRSGFQNAPGQQRPGPQNQPGQRQPGAPGQFGQRQQGAPNAPGGLQRQGLQNGPGLQRPSGAPNHPQRQFGGGSGQFGSRPPGLPGQIGGIVGRLGVPGLPIPQAAGAAPRSVPQGRPAQQRRPPPKQGQDRKKSDERN
ncbi:FecR domain-containing protein [Bradyrhizobium sp. SYSU BS000235]|uniref:FecR family protein n=1 Tax=Bradyrhizobium sp. SYSU BS000235 TaxID=3411332 RepID=UPI003C76D72C